MIRAALALLLLASAPAAAQDHPATPGTGTQGEGPHACIKANACQFYDDPYNHNCGSRGGPGCRKEDGRCASWKDGFARDCRVPERSVPLRE